MTVNGRFLVDKTFPPHGGGLMGVSPLPAPRGGGLWVLVPFPPHGGGRGLVGNVSIFFQCVCNQFLAQTFYTLNF